MTKLIHEKIWELSAKLKMPGSYPKLQELTQQLINSYSDEGRLDEDPFTSTTKRTLSLPTAEVNKLLQSGICLVTGGLGCVGSTLVGKLLSFEISRIIVVDKQLADNTGIDDPRITYIQADICEPEMLNTIFETYGPQFVFHTAAQRDPGYAETHAFDTIQTNVIGTLNLLQACENSKTVKQCVFSSTGKASRYYTNEVYAATKKICEYMFDEYARKSTAIRYSIVRFTHILDNSLMNRELKNIYDVDYLALHSPGKYVTAQNASEAALLMLNALLYSHTGRCNFLIVRHLEWPVESLEVALYHIKAANSSIPIIFKGNPPGYCEKFFRGQMDWSSPQELNLLINVYEYKHRLYNLESDIIISYIPPTNSLVLQNALFNIKKAENEADIKDCLQAESKKIIQAALVNVDKQTTVNILQWGLNPQYLAAEGTTIDDYTQIVSLLFNSLESSPYSDQVKHLFNQSNYFSENPSAYGTTH